MRACVRVCVGVGREKVCTATGAAAAAAAFDGVFVSKDKCEPLILQAGGWGRTSGDREEPRTHCVTTGLKTRSYHQSGLQRKACVLYDYEIVLLRK